LKHEALNGKDKKMNNLRKSKTHPMVLVAATALTLFSLLGSAAISGLLPTAADKQEVKAFDEKSGASAEQQSKSSSADNRSSSEKGNQQLACLNCGTVVAILALEGEISNTSGDKEYRMAQAYQIKVRMHNGSYQTLVQHTRPRYLVGDVIRLERRQATV
jgi:hypothetical protein